MVGILGVIDSKRQTLTRAERVIADAIIADPDAAVGRTIGQLARMAGTSEATVTRFCRSLGLSGYPQLRLQLAVEIEQRRGDDRERAGIMLPGDVEPGEPLADVIKKVALADAQAVELTVAQLDLDTFTAVVDAIMSARRVLVFGVGSSAPVAIDAASKLNLSGCAAQASADVHAGLMTTALFSPKDMALGFSHSGRSREVVEVLNEAEARGATTVVVTSDAGSPAARSARHILLTAARELTFRSGGIASRIAQLAVVDCIFAAISHHRFDRSLEATEQMHDAVSGHVIGASRNAK